MTRKRFSVHTRFLALRACLMILRDKSVAWNLNVTDGGFDSRTDDMLAVGVTFHGEPMSPDNFSFGDPRPQPD